MIADEQFVYFSSSMSKSIVRASANHLPPSRVLKVGPTKTLTLDEANVYYLQLSECLDEECDSAGYIGKVGKSGGDGQVLASNLTVAKSDLFVNATWLYFNGGGDDDGQDAGGGIARLSTDGGEVESFAPEARAVKMTFDASYAYWMGSAAGEHGIFRQSLTGGSAELVLPIETLKFDMSVRSYLDFTMDHNAFVWTDRLGAISMLAR